MVGLFQTIPIIKEYSISFYLSRSLLPLISGALMYCVLIIVGNLINTPVLRVLVCVLVVAFFYMALIVFFYSKTNIELMEDIFKIIKSRINIRR